MIETNLTKQGGAFYSHSTICLHCLADANALARVAGKLVDYSRWLGRLEVRSRDFH